LKDKDLNFERDDMTVFLVVDGHDQLQDNFLRFAKAKKFYNVKELKRGSMEEVNGVWRMKPIAKMHTGAKEEQPDNILHCFSCRSWDFGIPDKVPKL
jgi:hypothetical protein